jgi:ABC-2 type transport system permease protein
MNTVLTLLLPRWQAFQKGRMKKGGLSRAFLFLSLGLVFWAGIFSVTYRVLRYFQSIEGVGDLLAYKLLSMVLVTCLSLLVFSAILTSLTKLYLSRDLYLVHSVPVESEKIFIARWLESAFDSAWMVVIYTLPIFLSYGLVFKAGAFFYVNIFLVMVPLCLLAAGVSALFVMLLVISLPANRIRSIFTFLGLAILIGLYIVFRLLRPERLVDPEAFSTLMGYLNAMQAPASGYLPSTWAYDGFIAALKGRSAEALFHAALCASAAMFLLMVNIHVARWVYFKGFSKTQATRSRLIQSTGPGLFRVFSILPGPVRALTVKELTSFWRDQTQWSQVFIILALVCIYLYNFAVLPLDKSPIPTAYLQNLFSFLNVALAGFVLTAVVGRFAFPSVSMEGSAFWIIRSAPVSIRAFLWIKFAIYLLPLLILSETLIVASNILLRVTPFMMVLSTITLFFLTPGVVAMGVGFGAAYPDFSSENPAQSVTSMGGLIFMVASAALIGAVIVVEAGPVYSVILSGIHGRALTLMQWGWLVGSFILATVISIIGIFLPMRFGERRLSAS